ncbi:MAG: RIP metalloprotease RseP [Alphaproteobacteria bacterium]|nr:RIP metalloprotease RseP [Alphaproteobacteria bacterium]
MHDIFHLAQHYALPFLVVISVVVFVHEFGHYWVARRCGVKVETFSIGFGGEIFGWNDKHGTRWKVSWLPLGGYVKMFGDADPASSPDPTVHKMTAKEKKVAFYHQSVNKRMAIVVAGPLFNYLFAILVLALLFMFQGQPYSPPTITGVTENGVAAKAGIKPGDRFVTLDGYAVDRFEDIKRIVTLNAGTPIAVEVERESKRIRLKLTPEIVSMKDNFGGEHKGGRIGIATDKLDYRKWPPLRAVKEAALETWNLTASTLKAVGQIIMGLRGAEELGGPLRIAEMSGKVAKDGAISLVWFMGVISINLGLINLFPVPLLDGGHLAFYLVEKLRGRALNEHMQEISARVGMILVLSLMVFATWNDLVHLKVIAYLRGLFS